MKLLTLNLRHNEDRWEERFPLVVDIVAAEAPDVIAFQEVWLAFRQAHLIADALCQRAPQLAYEVYVEPKWGDNPVEGIGMLSRWPILERERLELPEGGRVAQRIRLEAGGHVFNVANVHLHHRPMEDESIRLPQMQRLLAWMREQPEGWLLAGDMNAMPGCATIAAAKTSLSSAYEVIHGREPDATFPTPLVSQDYAPGLAIVIDYIFFDTRHFKALDARRIADQPHPDDPTLYPSDHYGLAAEFHPRNP